MSLLTGYLEVVDNSNDVKNQGGEQGPSKQAGTKRLKNKAPVPSHFFKTCSLTVLTWRSFGKFTKTKASVNPFILSPVCLSFARVLLAA